MKYSYNHSYYPAAPQVDLSLIASATGQRVGPFSAFLDIGADATIIPGDYLRSIQAPTTSETNLRSQWGERHRVMLYLVDIQIGKFTLSDIEVVGDEISDEIILGRDVLNQLQVFLNGPKEVVEVEE